MNFPSASRKGGLSPSRRLSGARGQTAFYLSWRLRNRRSLFSAVAFLFLSATLVLADPLIVGSKKFTESYVLAEIAKRSLEKAGIKVEHRQGMGGTFILWEALRGGGIDVYP